MKQLYKNILGVGMVLGYIGTVVVNALANILPINGNQTGDLSDAIPNLFVPSGLTFAVWGAIYAGLALLSIYTFIALFKFKDERSNFVEKMGIEFIVSSVANITWILLWHYELINLSLLAMLILLGTLLTMYLRLKIGKSDAGRYERWFVHIPLSIYVGWITIATVANVTAVIVTNDWQFFLNTPVFWTIFMLAIATVITLLMLFLRKDIAYSLVVIWSFLGIILKRVNADVIAVDGTQIGIVTTAGVGIGLIVALIGYVIFQQFSKSDS